jgi:hypothetical protein
VDTNLLLPLFKKKDVCECKEKQQIYRKKTHKFCKIQIAKKQKWKRQCDKLSREEKYVF